MTELEELQERHEKRFKTAAAAVGAEDVYRLYQNLRDEKRLLELCEANVGQSSKIPNVGQSGSPQTQNETTIPDITTEIDSLEDIDGSRRDWSKDSLTQESNIGQQADGFRETELPISANIGFEDINFQRDSCVHEIPYRYFCPICDGGFECDGHHCPEGPHDHYV